jgi:hypothetical protein
MQQQTLHKKGNESPAYLDPQMVTRTNVHLNQPEVVAMRHYKDKEMLVVPFNTGNHWVTPSIFTKYNQVWYYDSSRLTDPVIGGRLIHDWNDVIFIIDE